MSGAVLEEKRAKYQLLKEQIEGQVLSEEEIAEKVKYYEQSLLLANKAAQDDILKCEHYLDLINELLIEAETETIEQ